MARKHLIVALEETQVVDENTPVIDETAPLEGETAEVSEVIAPTDEDVLDSNLSESRAAIDDTVSETNEVISDINDETVAIEEALADMNTLTDIRDTMVDSLKDDGKGLSETAAGIAATSLENICTRLGFQAEYRPIPATESFGITGSRQVQTQIAIEGIGDALGKIWAGIVAASERISKKVSLFLAGLTENVKIIIEHLSGLKERVNGLDANGVKAKEALTTSSLTNAFSDDKVANFKVAMDIISRTNTLVANGKGLVKEVLTLSGYLDKAASSMESGYKILNDVNVKFTKAIDTQYGNLSKITDKVPMKVNIPEANAKFYGPFVKNSCLAIFKNKDSVVGVHIFMGAFSDTQADSIEALDKGQMLKLLDSTLALLKSVEDFASSRNQVDEVFSSLEEAAKKAAQFMSGSESGEFRDTAEELRDNLKKFNKVMAFIGTDIPNLGITTGKAVDAYITSSIGNWKAQQASE